MPYESISPLQEKVENIFHQVPDIKTSCFTNIQQKTMNIRVISTCSLKSQNNRDQHLVLHKLVDSLSSIVYKSEVKKKPI